MYIYTGLVRIYWHNIVHGAILHHIIQAQPIFLLQADQIEIKIIHNNYKVLMVGLVELMTSFIKMMLCLDNGYASRSFLAI